MHNLTLEPGARLFGAFDDEGTPQTMEVTPHAHQFLFEPVELAEGVTLADIFGLLTQDPVLVQIYRRDFAAELLAHVQKGALKPENSDKKDGIEYLELYQVVEFDTSTQVLEGGHRLDFHGIGFEMPEDVDMGGYTQPKGSRIQWSISMTDVRELLALPLRVKKAVIACEDDLDSKGFGRKLIEYQRARTTLGQVIHGVLWELSFHGEPSSQAEFREDLMDRKDEVDEAIEREKNGEPSVFISGDDFFEEFDKPGVNALFESIGNLRARDITRALRELEDDDNVPNGLAAQLGERAAQLVIRAEFIELPARAFRKALREAKRA